MTKLPISSPRAIEHIDGHSVAHKYKHPCRGQEKWSEPARSRAKNTEKMLSEKEV